MIKQCEQCNGEFNARRSSVRFCGKECQAKAYSEKMKGKSTHKIAKQKPITAVCEICNKVFPVTTNSSNKYCSQECWKVDVEKHAAKKEQERLLMLTSQICRHCNGTFGADKITTYCSDDCRLKATKERQESYYKQVASKRAMQKRMDSFIPTSCQCKECGATFVTTYDNQRNTYCSNKCLNKATRKASKYKRKMLMKEQWVEYVSLDVLCERDNYICQLCNKPVDMKLKGTSEANAPSHDHIIPISMGGEHSYANAQLAHHRCNSIKSNNVDAEMISLTPGGNKDF